MPRAGDGERLSASDASNVVMDADDQVNVFLMAGTLGPGGFVSSEGTFDLNHLRSAIDERLSEDGSAGLGRFSQRVHRAGRHLVWEFSAPDLAWHVRSVDPVHGEKGLAELCGMLMLTPMPPDRPLWELLIVPGAGTSGPGVILRVHHAVSDGVAGVRLVQRLFGEVAGPGAARAAQRAVAAPARRGLRAIATGAIRMAAMFRATVPPTVLLGPIGPSRGVAFADVDLGRLASGASEAGATINDALLAAVAVATSAALRAGGEPVPETLPASVPVALPNIGRSGNAVGVMVAGLPTTEMPRSVRLAKIATTTRAAKQEARSQGTYELTRTSWGTRLFAWLARRQHFIALFVTNVPGPDQPLLIAGAPLEKVWPVAAIQGNVRLGVAALSYGGRLGCGVHVDAGVLDANVLGHALGDELHQIAGSVQ